MTGLDEIRCLTDRFDETSIQLILIKMEFVIDLILKMTVQQFMNQVYQLVVISVVQL